MQSPNQDSREGAPIKLVILHYTGMATAAEALQRLCDPLSKVSAHYLVEASGRIHALVSEEACAWHAGRSCWRGRSDINRISIGIELEHPGHERPDPYPEPQVAALEDLLGRILSDRQLRAEAVVGHSDVAPCRKRDPGEWFPWARLARRGLAVWPQAKAGRLVARPPNLEMRLLATLRRIGYDAGGDSFLCPAARASLRAFQRRFRPSALNCPPDLDDLIHARQVAAACGRELPFRH